MVRLYSVVSLGVRASYSIEPFLHESDPRLANNSGVFEQYIYVKKNDLVRKGDMIARMYLPSHDVANQTVMECFMHSKSYIVHSL